MLELLWKLGVLTAVLVFGVKIGLAMGFANLSKKLAALIAVGYGVGILILTKITEGYADVLQKIVYDYNFIIFVLMAIIIFYAGFRTVKEWKIHKKNQAKASCMAMVAPCPCCFGAILATIVLVSPLIGISTFSIGVYAALFLSITIGISYLASNYIIKMTQLPYPILLGNYMIFVGLYFLAAAIILPNINSVLSSQITPLEIPSVITIFYVVVALLALTAVGVYISKKTSPLIE
ncbi:MAG: DUF2162 domain-containing protein [Methanobacteriaceae archaeon]|nr:DUF2162 domain-containing protein [Methanobacteriaceae archaeon]